MSISPAQVILQESSAENIGTTGRSARSTIPAATPAKPPVESPASAPAFSSAPPISTDMRIDDQHKIYYVVVNDRSGDVVMEIPPEVIRKLGETLNVPLVGESLGHSVDVKS